MDQSFISLTDSRRNSLTSVSSLKSTSNQSSSIIPRNLSTDQLMSMDDKFTKKSLKKSFSPVRGPTQSKILSPVQLQIQNINNLNSNQGFQKSPQGTYLFPNGEVFRPRTTPSKRNRPPKIQRNNSEAESSIPSSRNNSISSMSTLPNNHNNNNQNSIANETRSQPINSTIANNKVSAKNQTRSESLTNISVLNNNTVPIPKQTATKPIQHPPTPTETALSSSPGPIDVENFSLHHSNSTVTRNSEKSNSLVNRSSTNTPQTSIDADDDMKVHSIDRKIDQIEENYKVDNSAAQDKQHAARVNKFEEFDGDFTVNPPSIAGEFTEADESNDTFETTRSRPSIEQQKLGNILKTFELKNILNNDSPSKIQNNVTPVSADSSNVKTIMSPAIESSITTTAIELRQSSLTPPSFQNSDEIYSYCYFETYQNKLSRSLTPKQQITNSEDRVPIRRDPEYEQSTTKPKFDDILIPPRGDLISNSGSYANLTLAESPRTSRFFSGENNSVISISKDSPDDVLRGGDNSFGISLLNLEDLGSKTAFIPPRSSSLPASEISKTISNENSTADNNDDKLLSTIFENSNELLKALNEEFNIGDKKITVNKDKLESNILSTPISTLKPPAIGRIQEDSSNSKLSLNELDDLKPFTMSLNKLMSPTIDLSEKGAAIVPKAPEPVRRSNSISLIANTSKKFTKSMAASLPLMDKRRSSILENPDNDFSFSSDVSNYNVPLVSEKKSVDAGSIVSRNKEKRPVARSSIPKRKPSNGFKTFIKKIFAAESGESSVPKRGSSLQHHSSSPNLSPKKAASSETNRARPNNISSIKSIAEETPISPPTRCGSMLNISRLKRFNGSTKSLSREKSKSKPDDLHPPSISEFNPNVKVNKTISAKISTVFEELPLFESENISTFDDLMNLMDRDYSDIEEKDLLTSGNNENKKFRFAKDNSIKSTHDPKALKKEESIFRDDELTKDQIMDQQQKDIDDEYKLNSEDELPLNIIADEELYIDDNIRSLQQDFSNGLILQNYELIDYSNLNSPDLSKNSNTFSNGVDSNKFKHTHQFRDYGSIEVITDEIKNAPKDMQPAKNILKVSTRAVVTDLNNSNSSSSTSISTFKKNTVQFSNKIFINETYPPESYKRYNKSVTQYTLNDPFEIHKIKNELNSYKQNDMRVHELSQQNTHFFYEL